MTGDPFADPRAAELLAASPDDVAAAAARLRAAGGESGQVAAGLAAAQRDATWHGAAAEAFHRAIGRLPGTLEAVDGGFGAVAAALGAYEADLAQIRPAFIRLADQLEDPALCPEQRATLDRQALELLDEFDTARRACQAAIATSTHPLSGQGTTVSG